MISIIIPVKDQIEYTRMILADIPKKIKSEYEIIVIDDGESDTNYEFLQSQPIRHYSKPVWVNEKWNFGVDQAKGDYVFIINNDIVLTEWIDIELIESLQEHKIACPVTTVGKDKWKLPLLQKTTDIAGWAFMLKREDWVHIDDRINTWFGDTYLFNKLWKDVWYAWLCHHFESKTLKSPELKVQIEKRIRKDKLHWEDIKQENNW